jgi:ribosomal protein S18 acetylase RimI-like enzyme
MIGQSEHILKNGEQITIRKLSTEDSLAFGDFLEGLSDVTKSKYGPHPLTREEAKNICANLETPNVFRIISSNQKGEIVGYAIFSFQLRESQVERYKTYGILLGNQKDACIAPVVADEYQNKGLGSIMLEELINMAKRLGVRYLILWQGVQAQNEQAIHFYEKFGFRRNGEFDRYGTHNIDMVLDLSSG